MQHRAVEPLESEPSLRVADRLSFGVRNKYAGLKGRAIAGPQRPT